jgi:hypothetical protein
MITNSAAGESGLRPRSLASWTTAINPKRLKASRYSVFAAALIAAWFFYFAGDGLWAPFTSDDLMNLHHYMQRTWATWLIDNARYWSTAYRPMGALFYTTLYGLFGFNPLPFRIVCFAFLALNLVLLFIFARQISGSSAVALFAIFLLSYHAWFVDLYYSSGTVYDVLCFSFYFAAFTLYIRIRQGGRLPSWRESLLIAVLYIGAMDAKEMAVTFPVFLLIYEAIYNPPNVRSLRSFFRWPLDEARTAILTGVLTVPYVVVKLTGVDSLVENPAYRLSISPGRFLDTFHLYLNPFLYQDHVFHDSNTVQLLIGMLAFALWQRSRSLVFSWLFLLLSLLPVAFINHYSAFFMYIPAVGWAIYAGELLRFIRQAIFYVLQRLFTVQATIAATAIVMAGLILILLPLHLRESVKTSRLFRSVQPPSREIAAELRRQQPSVKRGARLLFVNDPFRNDPYFLLFLTRLLYNDMTIEVTRTAEHQVSPDQYGRYDAVFIFTHGITFTRSDHS